MSFRLKLGCDEANHICDKSQYKEAKFWEKLKLIIHLTYCKACQNYTKNNTKLTHLVKNPEVKTMNESTKSDLKARLAEELAKQNNN